MLTKGKGTARAKVTFDHLDLVAFRQILDVERTRDIQLFCDLLADTLDAADRFNIQLLCGKTG